ncbi:MAG: hypothetical protein HYX89_05030 [Chloroflexi bacterium]|nr:hypothetical protein [Chloroflexota bacterium]
MVSEEALAEAIGRAGRITHIRLTPYRLNGHVADPVDPRAARLVSGELARQRNLIPIAQLDGVLVVAMADPLDEDAIAEIQRLTGLAVQPVVSPRSDIRAALDRLFAPPAPKPEPPTPPASLEPLRCGRLGQCRHSLGRWPQHRYGRVLFRPRRRLHQPRGGGALLPLCPQVLHHCGSRPHRQLPSSRGREWERSRKRKRAREW